MSFSENRDVGSPDLPSAIPLPPTSSSLDFKELENKRKEFEDLRLKVQTTNEAIAKLRDEIGRVQVEKTRAINRVNTEGEEAAQVEIDDLLAKYNALSAKSASLSQEIAQLKPEAKPEKTPTVTTTRDTPPRHTPTSGESAGGGGGKRRGNW